MINQLNMEAIYLNSAKQSLSEQNLTMIKPLFEKAEPEYVQKGKPRYFNGGDTYYVKLKDSEIFCVFHVYSHLIASELIEIVIKNMTYLIPITRTFNDELQAFFNKALGYNPMQTFEITLREATNFEF